MSLAVNNPVATFHRRRTPPAVVVEVLGQPYDDVIVQFAYSQDAVDVIRALPAWARHFDRAARVWFVNPGYAGRLAADLGRGGRVIIWPCSTRIAA